MINDNKIDDLIGMIYEAALDPNQWNSALSNLRDVTQSAGVQYLIVDESSSGISLQLTTEFDESVLSAYVEHYWEKDPRAALIPDMDTGTWMRCHEHYDNRFVSRNEFYQDYLIPSGLRYQMGGKLISSDGALALISFLRGPDANPFSDADKAFAERLTGHLQRAAKLAIKQLGTLSENTTLTQAFERMQDACFVLNERGKVLQTNAAAESMLRINSTSLRVRGGHLEVSTPSEQQRLLAAVAACSSTSHQKSHAKRNPGSTLVLKRRPPRPALIIEVLPIPPSRLPGVGLMIPTAMVWIIDPLIPRKTSCEFLRGLYGLTNAEVRVAEALALGKSLQVVANDHGVSRETVKTQASAIYGKTSTKGQAELISLVARIHGD